MQKKIIIVNPDEPDIIIVVDDASNRFTVDTNDGQPPMEDEVPEGLEQQTADVMFTLADHFGSKVPGRPTPFAREWTKMSNFLGEKISSSTSTDEFIESLDDGVRELIQAYIDGDIDAMREHVTGFIAVMMALDHRLGLRVAEKVVKAAKE